MSNVQRYTLRIVERYAADGSGEVETYTQMKPVENGQYVLASDHEKRVAELEAELAEAEALLRVMHVEHGYRSIADWLARHGGQSEAQKTEGFTCHYEIYRDLAPCKTCMEAGKCLGPLPEVKS